METDAHRTLKRLGIEFLRKQGCMIFALEVRCPISRYIVDVAAYWDRLPKGNDGGVAQVGTLWEKASMVIAGSRGRRIEPRTVMIECKQERSDFLRDRSDRGRLLVQRERLHAQRERIEQEHIRSFEPHLRRSGSALFEEMEVWEYERSRLGDYRRTLRELRRLDEQIHGETKFCMAARYRLADRLYLLAPEGMIRAREVPPGWGLLECRPGLLRGRAKSSETLRKEPVTVRVAAPALACREERRVRFLRNIAAAACRSGWGGQRAEEPGGLSASSVR